jgi:hypothetical protein
MDTDGGMDRDNYARRTGMRDSRGNARLKGGNHCSDKLAAYATVIVPVRPFAVLAQYQRRSDEKEDAKSVINHCGLRNELEPVKLFGTGRTIEENDGLGGLQTDIKGKTNNIYTPIQILVSVALRNRTDLNMYVVDQKTAAVR